MNYSLQSQNYPLVVDYYFQHDPGTYDVSSSYTFDIEKVAVVDSDIDFSEWCKVHGHNEKEVYNNLYDECLEAAYEPA